MTIIEKIKAEVDKRYAEYREKMKTDDFTYYEGMADALDLFEQFIDSLESEKPMDLGERIGSYNIVPYIDDKIAKLQDMWREEKVSFDWDDLKDMIEGTARHFAQWGAEHLADDRKMSPKDLEEAADEYEKKHTYQLYDGGGFTTPEYDATPADAFIVGAKWQKQYDAELIEIAYNDGITIGMTKQKEQMMKEAVEGEVCIPNVWVDHKEGKELVVRAEISKELGFKFGEKVRIIIVKEDKS